MSVSTLWKTHGGCILVVSLSMAGNAFASIGPNSKIPPIMISPTQSAPYDNVVHIETSTGTPWAGVQVSLVFPPEACDLLILCGSSYQSCPQTFSQNTDPSGNAHFVISGGGCWGSGRLGTGLSWSNETLPESYLVQVYVGTEKVAVRGVRSSDVVDNGAVLTSATLWCQSPPTSHGLSNTSLTDALFHTPHLKLGSFVPCTDVNGDGKCDLTDAVALTPGIKFGAACDEGN